MAFDISATGAKVAIMFSDGTEIEVTHFSDEGTPFESGDVDVSTNQKNLNGDMISSRTPSVYPVSLTVIPGSEEDLQLQGKLQEASLQPGGVNAVSDLWIESMQIFIPTINSSVGAGMSGSHLVYTWTKGRFKTGSTGPSTSAEGRLSARTYGFEFEKYVPASGTGASISALQA